jgi:hypothetical protein
MSDRTHEIEVEFPPEEHRIICDLAEKLGISPGELVQRTIEDALKDEELIKGIMNGSIPLDT